MLTEISHDIDEIFYGTINHLHPLFLQEEAEINMLESAQDRDEKRSQKAVEKVKRLMGSYYRLYGSSRSKTARMSDPDFRAIAQSKGNLAKIGNGGTLKGIEGVIEVFTKKFSALEALAKRTKEERQTLNNMKKCQKLVENLQKIKTYMFKFQKYYERSYETKSILVNQEYECSALVLLIGAVNAIVNTNFMLSDFEKLTSGKEASFHPADYARGSYSDYDVTISKSAKMGTGYSKLAERNFIRKIVNDLAKELSKPSHEEYLKGMNEAKIDKKATPENQKVATAAMQAEAEKEAKEVAVKESTYISEAGEIQTVLGIVLGIRDGIYDIVRHGISTIKVLWNSIFGIVPLIRSIIFLNHKKKINAIMALEENIDYLQTNIDSLKLNKNFKPAEKQKIINAQMKKLEGYKKKVAKMKAEFDIMEDDAEKMVKQSNTNLGKDAPAEGGSSSDGDLVLD